MGLGHPMVERPPSVSTRFRERLDAWSKDRTSSSTTIALGSLGAIESFLRASRRSFDESKVRILRSSLSLLEAGQPSMAIVQNSVATLEATLARGREPQELAQVR